METTRESETKISSDDQSQNQSCGGLRLRKVPSRREFLFVDMVVVVTHEDIPTTRGIELKVWLMVERILPVVVIVVALAGVVVAHRAGIVPYETLCYNRGMIYI